MIETSLKEILEKEAISREISFAELCREKLRGGSRLIKIELMLEQINKRLIENEQA
jgi:hypothetical protein